ncbi:MULTISPECIES: hypothetical protein [Leucobacter]|uniref:DUF2569 domain-containing protein n=1 Tax=Leucobacter manosquensis TaxID=2810611 RepID=A0ABS5M6P8_9MICO|nr:MULTISPECIES: hypothetical protein [Leucobacter]MBS3182673.1 hypothetical protein [Leucobacter manosquensis]
MMRDPGKRAASETVSALASPSAPAPVSAPRPASLTGGALLVLLRCVGGIVWVVSVFAQWPSIQQDLELDGVAPAVALGVLAAFEAVWLGALALFAWLLWRGSNRARMLAMGWAAVSVTASAVSYFAAGAEITVRTTLLTVSLDILLMLALSSRDARAWTLGRRDARRERRRSRHRTSPSA